VLSQILSFIELHFEEASQSKDGPGPHGFEGVGDRASIFGWMVFTSTRRQISGAVSLGQGTDQRGFPCAFLLAPVYLYFLISRIFFLLALFSFAQVSIRISF
jgi:hypothetical protein